MGVFRIPVEFANPEGTRRLLVEALVDTGATVCQLPAPLAADLGLVPSSRRRFRLASGESVVRPVSTCRVSFRGDSTQCDVVIGGVDSPAILGAVALEQMGLAVDPSRQEIVPADLWLLAAA